MTAGGRGWSVHLIPFLLVEFGLRAGWGSRDGGCEVLRAAELSPLFLPPWGCSFTRGGGGLFTCEWQSPVLLRWFRSGEGQVPSAAPNKGSGLLPFVSLVYLKSPVALPAARCPDHVAGARARP